MASQRLDATSAGRQPIEPAGATQPGTAVSGTANVETAVADVERLLDRAIHQIRTVGRPGDPAVEARLQDPELGTVRVLVAGRTGELIRAELVVTDQRLADALTRAVDRSATGHGLSGIELRIRTEPTRPGGDAAGQGPGSDSNRATSDQRGWASPNGGFDRAFHQRDTEPRAHAPEPRGPSPSLPVPSLAAVRQHLPIGSIDVRA